MEEYAFIVYEAQTSTGNRFRNSEVYTVGGRKLLATEVYFGWEEPHKVRRGTRGIMTHETAIRELIDRFVKAYRAMDIDGVISVFAPEIVSFDIVPPLQEVGVETFRNRWKKHFASYEAPIDFEVRDLSITAGDDVAFSHSLNRVSGTMKNGQKTERWLRWTACYRKTNGTWWIVHEQVSVPVDLRSGKAVLDLKP